MGRASQSFYIFFYIFNFFLNLFTFAEIVPRFLVSVRVGSGLGSPFCLLTHTHGGPGGGGGV